MDVGTYGGVTKVAFGDSLKESRFAHICKTDLQILSVAFNGLRGCCSSKRRWELHTIPLFKLLPGLPSRSFSSLTAFLGGIFFFAAKERFCVVVVGVEVEVSKTVQLSRLWC